MKITLLLTTLLLAGLFSVMTASPVRAAENPQWIAASFAVLPIGAIIAQDDEDECSDSNNDGECDPENMNQD